MARIILRRFSASASWELENFSFEIFVTPETMCATSSPKASET
jgi:hypothetical protein